MILPDSRTRSLQTLLVLRIVISCLIAAHGLARYWFDGIQPFGSWLDAQGFPIGVVIAYAITLLEIVGTPLLAFGIFVAPLCLAFATVYLFGIALVHAQEGWFVVGLGRNGMEYSVLLIICLLGIGYQHLPASLGVSKRDTKGK